MANSFYFNNVNLADYGVTIMKSPFPAMALPSVDIQQSAYGKANSYQQRYNSRNFNLSVLIEGSNNSELRSNIDSINSLFNQNAECNLRFDYYFNDRYWKARYIGGLENIKILNSFAVTCNLDFIAPDPIAFDISSTTINNISITSGNFSYDLSSVNGNTIIYPTITITAGASGSTSISVSNDQVNGTIYYSGTLSNTHKLRINSENFIVEKSTNGGSTYSNVMDHVTGTVPRLLGSATNTINITGVNNGGSLNISYIGRYL